jgi:AmmeMemoRadiSam system protein A
MALSPFLIAPAMRTEAGLILLPIARAAIARELGKRHAAQEEAEWLLAPGASFITLKQEGRLRGCIGTLRAHRALLDDVKANAVAAAFRDPRFKPLTAGEFEAIELELSLLSALEHIAFADEQQALAQLRVGVDGVVFEYGHHSSTFLPQVWEDMNDPVEFLSHLKHKAGLPPDFWDPQVRLSRYTVSKWRESDLR